MEIIIIIVKVILSFTVCNKNKNNSMTYLTEHVVRCKATFLAQ